MLRYMQQYRFFCKQGLCFGADWCFASLSCVKAIQWRKGESNMDEMVFLSILSNAFDFYWSTSYLYLWGYQFIVLAKNKAIV